MLPYDVSFGEPSCLFDLRFMGQSVVHVVTADVANILIVAAVAIYSH